MHLLIANIVIGLVLLLAATLAYAQDRDEALFRAGMQAMEDGAHLPEGPREEKFDEAIAAFRSILVDRPELVRVRLELARAFFLKEEDTLARRHFEQVLAGKPPQGVAANIARFLAIMRARRRWEAYFGAALAPDSNLNAASGDRTILIDTQFGRLPFTLNEDPSRKSGIGVSVWGGGEYQHPLADRLRLRSGGGASVREYKGGDFDRQSFHGHIGPRWLVDPRTEASLLATVQRQWSAGQPDTDEFGLRLEGRHRITPRLAIDGRLGARRRNVRDRNRLDGPVGEVGFGLTWAALPTLRLGVRAGHSWSRVNSKHWRTRGPDASLTAAMALPRGFTVETRAAMQWTDYGGAGLAHHTIDREPREDRTQTLSVSVYNRAITVLGFSPRLSLINEQRETNAQTLDYDRNRAELSFVRLF